MSELFLGIDAGSSITKAAVFTIEGRQLGRGAHRIELSRPHPGWSEIEPQAAWAAFVAAVSGALADANVSADEIAGIGISAAMVGAWVVDEKGDPLRPGIIWEDSRAQDLIEQRVRAVPDLYQQVFQSDGCVLQQGCTLPLMAWLKIHEPAIMERAAYIFSYKDFLRLKLTGKIAADRTEAAVAPGNASGRDHSPEMLDLFDIGDLAHLLPERAESESLAGHVNTWAAKQTGLRTETPVAIGAGDVPSTVTGAGALQSGVTLAVLGTTCIIGTVHDEPVFSPANLGLLFTLPGAAWYRSMTNVAGTLNLDWALGTLAPDLVGKEDVFEQVEALIAPIPIGCEGVVYLPYLSESGIIAPVVNPLARAAFVGLAPRHTRAHILRAVYEGVVLATRELFGLLDGAGRELILCGGGARSRIWTQMLSDALGVEVLVPEATELGARGAALLAATAVGRFTSIRQASVSTRVIERRHKPNPEAKAEWDRAFEAYRSYRWAANRA